ncbi:hypothetical protein KO505_11020, partial [Psychrosphaera sp. F3M07]|uniref:hypothetical protein n=1 Tax=Psychrosphaera sp. F3M07 TaxID=2841560 RepID=UPI001C0985FC
SKKQKQSEPCGSSSIIVLVVFEIRVDVHVILTLFSDDSMDGGGRAKQDARAEIHLSFGHLIKHPCFDDIPSSLM